MEIIVALIFGALIMAGGLKAKNTIEDEVTAGADSFTRWDSIFQKYGSFYNVPWPRLKAICMNESSLGDAPSVSRGLAAPNDVEGSKSSDGKSWGLMQVTIPTGRDFIPSLEPWDLNDPEISVDVAAQFLARLSTQFDSEEFIVKSYNQGAGNSRKEMRGEIEGYAGEYWARYQRNRAIIVQKQGV